MRATLTALLLVLAACDTGFKPVTLVEDMRLLGIRAEPASLRPGESTQLTALLLDPSRTQPNTMLWLGCEADPYNLNRSPCLDERVLQDASNLTGGTGALPPGVSLIGFNGNATYTAPAGLFDVLAPDDPRRQIGTVGLVLAFAIEETVSPTASMEELQALFERVQRKEVKSIVAIFRMPISESMVRNTNPVVDAMVVAGERWPKNARVLVREREPVTLDITAPDSTFEPYELTSPSGTEQKTERVLTSWFSTAGRFSEETTALQQPVKTIFTSPGASERTPVPEKRVGSFFTVFRDTRGGQSWREWPFFVCVDDAPRPVVRSVDWPSSVNDPVVLHGDELGSVVDLVVDGVALENGAYSASTGTWRGFLPQGVEPGSQRGVVHAKSCVRFALP